MQLAFYSKSITSCHRLTEKLLNLYSKTNSCLIILGNKAHSDSDLKEVCHPLGKKIGRLSPTPKKKPNNNILIMSSTFNTKLRTSPKSKTGYFCCIGCRSVM